MARILARLWYSWLKPDGELIHKIIRHFRHGAPVLLYVSLFKFYIKARLRARARILRVFDV